MNTGIIILGTVLIVLITYMIFQNYFDTDKKYNTEGKLNAQVTLTNDKLNKPGNANIAYGIWIYVEKWPTDIIANPTTAHIFKRETELELKFKTGGGLEVVTYNGLTENPPVTVTDNFPIQKWVYVTIAIENKIMDVYLDGKMVKSVGLQNALNVDDTKSLEFNSNGDMNTVYVADFYRFPRPLVPEEVWKNYMKGASSNALTRTAGGVKVNLSVLGNGGKHIFNLW
jgi:hypothetical protein